jgi:hypothetical protein
VPIIVKHVRAVLAQHQKKMEQINSTPSWQQSNMAHTDEHKFAQSQNEGKYENILVTIAI